MPSSSTNTTEQVFFDASGKETGKSALQKAQDVSYTINHAITCTVVDLLEIPFVAWLQNKFDGRSGKIPWEKVSRAEVIGDVGAVPLTILLQRIAPNAMANIGKWLDPLFGDLFRKGARNNANRWATKHGFSTDSQEATAKAREIYSHEAGHLGQAAVWTAGSFALNVLTQAAEERLTKVPLHQRTSMKALISGKGLGSLTSSTALVLLRGLAPGKAERWDQWTSETIFMPATKAVSGWFGVGEKEFADFKERNDSAEGIAGAPLQKPNPKNGGKSTQETASLYAPKAQAERPLRTLQELGNHEMLTPNSALAV